MYFSDGSKKEVIKSEVPYSLYVLALADEANTSTLNYYKSNPELLTQSGRYLIASAFALSGDKKKFYQMLPKGFARTIIFHGQYNILKQKKSDEVFIRFFCNKVCE